MGRSLKGKTGPLCNSAPRVNPKAASSPSTDGHSKVPSAQGQGYARSISKAVKSTSSDPL